jgi:hypothetical protein
VEIFASLAYRRLNVLTAFQIIILQMVHAIHLETVLLDSDLMEQIVFNALLIVKAV